MAKQSYLLNLMVKEMMNYCYSVKVRLMVITMAKHYQMAIRKHYH